MRYLAILSILFFSIGCSRPTLEDVTRDQLELMEDFTHLIDSIESEEDAREAIPELDKLTVRARRLKKKYHEVSIPTAEERKAVKNQFAERAVEVYEPLFDQHAKDNWSPKVEEILTPSAREFMGLMFEQRK